MDQEGSINLLWQLDLLKNPILNLR